VGIVAVVVVAAVAVAVATRVGDSTVTQALSSR
jgi:hypothetical protein